MLEQQCLGMRRFTSARLIDLDARPLTFEQRAMGPGSSMFSRRSSLLFTLRETGNARATSSKK
jgi:hypothetical protein